MLRCQRLGELKLRLEKVDACRYMVEGGKRARWDGGRAVQGGAESGMAFGRCAQKHGP